MNKADFLNVIFYMYNMFDDVECAYLCQRFHIQCNWPHVFNAWLNYKRDTMKWLGEYREMIEPILTRANEMYCDGDRTNIQKGYTNEQEITWRKQYRPYL